MTAATGTMCSAIRRASSATAARATASPACAAAKIARPSYGGVERRARARRRREPLRDRRERGRARVDVLVEPGRGVVELARRAVVAAVQLAAQHEPRAEPGADREEDEVVDAVGRAAPALAERREVDVVPHRDGESQRLAQLAPVQTPLEAGDVGDETDPVAVGLDGAGNADDDAVDRHALEAGGGDERVAQGGDGREHRVGVRARRSRCCAARRPAARGSLRGGRRGPPAGTARRGRARARAPPRAPARRTPRRRSGPPGWAAPRARARPRGGRAARARRSAWRCRRGGRSRPARWARRRGSPPVPCARSAA